MPYICVIYQDIFINIYVNEIIISSLVNMFEKLMYFTELTHFEWKNRTEMWMIRRFINYT